MNLLTEVILNSSNVSFPEVLQKLSHMQQMNFSSSAIMLLNRKRVYFTLFYCDSV